MLNGSARQGFLFQPETGNQPGSPAELAIDKIQFSQRQIGHRPGRLQIARGGHDALPAAPQENAPNGHLESKMRSTTFDGMRAMSTTSL